MQLAYLKEADQEEVARTVRQVLQDRGAHVTEHTRSHTRFDGLRDDESAFTKGGYVGTYQHVGEREVQLRFDVKASVPARLFRRTVTLEFVVVLLLLIWGPSPNTWIVAGVLLWTALLATGILYLNTWRSSQEVEEELLDATLDELHATAADALTEEERELEQLREELEAEVVRERLEERVDEEPAEPRDAPTKRARGLAARLVASASDAASNLKDAVTSSDEPVDASPASTAEDERQAKLQRVRELRERVARAKAAQGEDAPPEDGDDAEDLEAEKRRKLERIRELRERIQARKSEGPGNEDQEPGSTP